MEPCLLCGGLGLLSFPGSAREDFSVISVISGGNSIAPELRRSQCRHWYKAGGDQPGRFPITYFFPIAGSRAAEATDPDLASVRVPGELQVYWEFRASSAKSGSVRQQDTASPAERRAKFLSGQRSAEHVIHAGEPEASAIALNRGRLVFQYLDADGSECVGYVHRVGIEIMVPHDCPQAVRSGHLAKDVSAWFGGQCRFCLVSEQRHGNKIPSQHDQVGMETVDQRTRRMQRVHRTIRVVVKVAQESDGETVKPFGPARQREILVHDARAIWFQQE